MVKQLKILVRLQTIDKTLFGLLTEKDAIPESLGEHAQKTGDLKASLEEAKADLEKVADDRKGLEKHTDEIKARLRKSENRLMGSKTQREYQAANAEIEEGKDSLKGNEDLVLEAMERQEELDSRVKEEQETFDEVSVAAKKATQSLKRRSTKLKNEIARLEKKRGGMTEGVDQPLMDQYNFIRQRRQGVALAAVSKGTCLVCHMQIPPQQFNDLQRMDKLMSCPSCSRLLYWADAEIFQSEEE